MPMLSEIASKSFSFLKAGCTCSKFLCEGECLSISTLIKAEYIGEVTVGVLATVSPYHYAIQIQRQDVKGT